MVGNKKNVLLSMVIEHVGSSSKRVRSANGGNTRNLLVFSLVGWVIARSVSDEAIPFLPLSSSGPQDPVGT
jgi:hypothetical protein